MADWPYPLPAGTAEAFRGTRVRSNPGLLFQRFVPDLSAAYPREAARRAALEEVCNCRVDPDLLAAHRKRWRRTAEALGAVVFEGRTEWRLVVGLGRKGQLEVGFIFHQPYGFPMIPGSALKGLAASCATLLDGRDPTDSEVVAVFGKAAQEEMDGVAGGALFLDAIPAGQAQLEIDIINPHFPDYYRQGSSLVPPTDWQNPEPVPFLAVAPGTRFLFAVGWRGKPDTDRLGRAVAWLKRGLRELGVGAKTSAGYGYFVVEEVSTLPSAAIPGKAGAPQPIPEAARSSLSWRRGVVREYRSDKGVGRLANGETGRELRFTKEAIEEKGWTPGRRAAVEYATDEGGRRVVTLRRWKG